MSVIRRLTLPPLVTAALAAGTALVGVVGVAGPARAVIPASSTSAISGLDPLLPVGTTDFGPAGPAPRTITFALSLRDPSGLRAFLAGSHPSLTPTQFLTTYGPTTQAVAAVTSWAAATGLSVDAVSANRELVTVSGDSTVLGDALGTRFDRFGDLADGTWTGIAGNASLPAPVAAVTSAVLGLSDLGRLTRPLDSAKPAATLALGGSFGPGDFARIYDAPASATGTGQTAAVIAEGDLTGVRQDLVTFEVLFGLPQVPVTVIGAGSADTSGSDEYDLDTQYSTGFAPDVSKLLVYDGASLSNSDIATTINSWVSGDAAPQASFSAGECEVLASVAGFTTALDAILMQADAQGQSLFVSSGDNGSFCSALVGVNGVPAGVPSVEYPASSPFVIAVGGTTLVTDAPTEIAWYAGGGGLSYTEPAATFAANAGGTYLGINRGVPDVALDADPNSGYTVIVNGAPQTIGGTSASAPAWQGVWLRAQSAHGGALGFAGPVIYRVPASAFHDILIGAIGLYVATPGWDYTTGRGTPDIAAFVAAA